jgi:putative polymerase
MALAGAYPAAPPFRAVCDNAVLASRLGSQRTQVGKAMIPKRAWLACGLVFAAVTFNMVLCFLNTHVAPVNESHVIASEAFIVGLAGILSYRFLNTETLIVTLLFLAYLCATWLITGIHNPKTIRDFLIPVVFFALGYTSAKPEDADKFLYFLMILVLAMGLFESLFLDSFTKIFDILSYYIAKGAIDEEQTRYAATSLYLSGFRGEHELDNTLHFFGTQRVSSIFLEPVSVGAFSTISFMWLWLRRKAKPVNGLFLGICALLALMSDSRFAMLSFAILMLADFMPILRSRMVIFAMPFVFAAGLVLISSMISLFDMSSITGRLVYSGEQLGSLDFADWFGDFGTMPWLESDAGYAFVLNRIGLAGCVAIWMLFSASTPRTTEAMRFKALIAIYVCLSLSIGAAFFSIKTAALLWFLYGVLQSRRSEEREQWMFVEPPERRACETGS